MRIIRFFVVIGVAIAAALVMAWVFDRLHRGAKIDGQRVRQDRDEAEADRERLNLPVWRR